MPSITSPPDNDTDRASLRNSAVAQYRADRRTVDAVNDDNYIDKDAANADDDEIDVKEDVDEYMDDDDYDLVNSVEDMDDHVDTYDDVELRVSTILRRSLPTTASPTRAISSRPPMRCGCLRLHQH